MGDDRELNDNAFDGLDSKDQERVARPDPVEEASEESFPASDPPAWEPLHSGPPSDPSRDSTSG